jgi:crossover junction endodeoxyribonuclease RuvC
LLWSKSTNTLGQNETFLVELGGFVFHLGLDPGKSGGAVLLSTDFKIVKFVSFKSELDAWPQALLNLIREYKDSGLRVWVESVHSRPGQGVSTVFEFGRVFGLMCGLVYGSDLTFGLMTPQVWQKLAWAEGTGERPWSVEFRDNPKGRSLASARLYWGDEVFQGKRGGFHDGLVDAALIARAGILKSQASADSGSIAGQIDLVAANRREKMKEKKDLLKRKRKRLEAKCLN